MATIITEQTRVQYGVATSHGWAGHLDGLARAALRRLVPKDAVVAAVGEWGRQEGCSTSVPAAVVIAHPQHTPIILNELRHAIPSAQFLAATPAPSMRAALHDARVLWGHRSLPAPPIGDAFAREWAPARQHERLVFSHKHAAPSIALHDWYTARLVCAIGCREVPATMDLSQDMLDLYVVRNLGVPDVPASMRQFVDTLGWQVGKALRDLAAGRPSMETAAELHTWLFAES